MDDTFKIYVEQLRDGQEKEIEEDLNPSFLDIHESDLAFEKNVKLNGVAYLAEQELILHWEIETEALLSCSICNEKVKVPIHIPALYHAEPLAEIKTGVFDFKELLRDTILLETPPFAECEGGRCSKRKEIEKYLKEASEGEPDDGYHPFADLDLK